MIFPKSNCSEFNMFCSSKYVNKEECNIFSMIFDNTGNKEIGLRSLVKERSKVTGDNTDNK